MSMAGLIRSSPPMSRKCWRGRASLPGWSARPNSSRGSRRRPDMAEYVATIDWRFDGGDFAKGRYSRAHRWAFDGGVEIPASSSPHVVPVPFSDPGGVDPEEALVASASSCHMLSFLH